MEMQFQVFLEVPQSLLASSLLEAPGPEMLLRLQASHEPYVEYIQAGYALDGAEGLAVIK